IVMVWAALATSTAVDGNAVSEPEVTPGVSVTGPVTAASRRFTRYSRTGVTSDGKLVQNVSIGDCLLDSSVQNDVLSLRKPVMLPVSMFWNPPLPGGVLWHALHVLVQRDGTVGGELCANAGIAATDPMRSRIAAAPERREGSRRRFIIFCS